MESVRYGLCRHCPHWKHPDANGQYPLGRCNYLIENTGKAGSLSHKHGIGNPRSRCPNPKDRKWNELESYHAWYFRTYIIDPSNLSKRLFPTRESTYLKYKLTQIGVSVRDSITWAVVLHETLSDAPLRSQLVKVIEELMDHPNNYSYLSIHLKMDYAIGKAYTDTFT